MTREPSNRETVVLLPRDDEVSLTEEMENRQKRERALAKLRLLWERRRFLLKVTAVGFAVSILLALMIHSRYESTTRLMPPDQQSGSGFAMLAAIAGKAGASSGGLGGLAGDVLGLKTSGDLFLGVLRSRTVQDDLISKFDLRKAYGTKRWEDARKVLTARTSLTSDRKSGIITIVVTDRSPQRAAALAQEYVAELNWVITQLNTSSAHRERVFLEGRLQQVKEDLETSEKNFSQFASKNSALDIKEQGKAMIQASAALQGQLIAARTELDGLRQVYTESNVRVRSMQARVDELQRELQKLGGGAAPQADNAANPEFQYPTLRKLPLLGVGYADLLRRTQVQEAVFESLTKEYELAKVQEAKETPSVKVLDPAEIPEEKSYPPRALIVICGSIFVGLLGVAWVMAGARWREVDSHDPGKALAQEVFQTAKSSVLSILPRGSRLRAFAERRKAKSSSSGEQS